MTLDDIKPKPYQFTQKEMQDIAETFSTPLIAAYLQSLEVDAMIAQHSVNIAENINDAPMRIVANEAFVQGQLHLIRVMRSLRAQLNDMNKKEEN